VGWVLGLSGGPLDRDDPAQRDFPRWFFHDASAVLVHDGDVVAAAEEERFSRIKHTNAFPRESARWVLAEAGVTADDLDAVAFFFDEWYVERELTLFSFFGQGLPGTDARSVLAMRLTEALGAAVDPPLLRFVPHHRAHAVSSFRHSGLSDALVVVADGNGEHASLTLYAGNEGALEEITSFPAEDSLGHLYTRGTEILGYGAFDEFRVMGLAAYGDPAPYRHMFREVVHLEPEGRYRVEWGRLQRDVIERRNAPVRRRDEPLTAAHRDFAAALQDAIESVLVHVTSYHARTTGLRALCLSGGVGHNSTANALLLRSGSFDTVFVHPAAHDSGAAVGAALDIDTREATPPRIGTCAWGPLTGDPDRVREAVAPWAGVWDAEPCEPVATAADLLAADAVVAWAQGRAEFGPRALDHRSILADPRAPGNTERINALIKERESYRPFAPSVRAEDAAELFEVADDVSAHAFMGFAVPVRPAWRDRLRAVTHVDGTARVQVVDRAVSPLFWRLLTAFAERTGIPVLLNTSFNSFAEPMVLDERDAVLCLLTTGLTHLVIGSTVVHRKQAPLDVVTTVVLTAQPAVRLVRDPRTSTVVVERAVRHARGVRVPEPVHEALVSRRPLDVAEPSVRCAVETLWRLRLVDVQPA
jgi:predicted NodU family carbamoyl transferase